MRLAAFAGLAVTLATVCIAGASAAAVTATRMQDVPLLGASPRANASSVFPYSYNPSWFVPPGHPAGCLLVRVQNRTSATNPSPGPSAMAASCVSVGGDPLLSFEPITEASVVFRPSTPQEVQGTEDPRIAQVGNTFFMFYTAVQIAPDGRWIARLSLASTTNPLNATAWTRHGALFPDVNNYQFTKSGALLVNPSGPSYLIFGDCSLYNGLQVAVPDATFTRYSVLEDVLLITTRGNSFDSELVESGPPPMQLDDGNWLFIYNAAQRLHGVPNQLFYAPGFVILNGSNPLHVLQRSDEPLVMPMRWWETEGLTPYVVFVEAMRYANPATTRNHFVAYYGAADTGIGALAIHVTATSHGGTPRYFVSASQHHRPRRG